MVGGVLAAVIYYLLIELHHPRDDRERPHGEEVEEELEDEDEEEDEDMSLKDKYEMITMS